MIVCHSAYWVTESEVEMAVVGSGIAPAPGGVPAAGRVSNRRETVRQHNIRRRCEHGLLRVAGSPGQRRQRMGGRMYRYLLSIPRDQYVPTTCWRPNNGPSVGLRPVNSDSAAPISPAWRCRIDLSAGLIRAARGDSRSTDDRNRPYRCRRSLGVTLGPRSRQYRHPRLQRGAPAPGGVAPAGGRRGQACRRGGDPC